MSLIEERNRWRHAMQEGKIFVPHPMYEEYKLNRNSELWRSSRQLERLFEYINYLEEMLSNNNS